jgi:hypothetical protein
LRDLSAVQAARLEDSAPEALEDPIEAARREGYALGRAEAQAEAQSQIEDADARAEAERLAALAQARALWAQAEGEALAQRIEAAFGALRGEIENGVAAALRPLALREAGKRAAEAMAEEVARLLAAGAADDKALEIAAPPDLIEALRVALRAAHGVEADDPRIRFVAAAGADAVAKLGRLRVETRLAGLTRRLGDTFEAQSTQAETSQAAQENMRREIAAPEDAQSAPAPMLAPEAFGTPAFGGVAASLFESDAEPAQEHDVAPFETIDASFDQPSPAPLPHVPNAEG